MQTSGRCSEAGAGCVVTTCVTDEKSESRTRRGGVFPTLYTVGMVSWAQWGNLQGEIKLRW